MENKKGEKSYANEKSNKTTEECMLYIKQQQQ